MTRIVPFDVNYHYGFLNSWLVRRNAYVTPKDEIPALGFVAYVDNVPTAMAFIRRVEGGYGQYDGQTTNPEASSEQRHVGLTHLIEAVIEAAKAHNIKGLTAFTTDESTFSRATQRGFTVSSHAVMALNLRKNA